MKKIIVMCSLIVVQSSICTTKYDYVQHEDASKHGNGTCLYNCAHQLNRCLGTLEDNDTVEEGHCHEARAYCGGGCND